MSIRKTVQELRGMAENLEASGFENGQAQSTIETIAVSIERFAVTPEVLAREFAKQNEAIDTRITGQFAQFREEIDRRFAQQSKEVDRRFAQQNEALDTRMTGQFAQFREEFDRRFTEQSKEFDRRFALQNEQFDRRMAAQDKAWNTRFAEQNNEWNTRFAEQNSDMNRQFTELRAAIKSIGTRQFAMMWGVIVMMLGLLATNFMQQVL